MKYQYTEKNLLQEPNTYMYTPFQGQSLFQAYASERLEKIRLYSSYTGINSKIDEYLIIHGTTVIEDYFNQISANNGKEFKNTIGNNYSNSSEYVIDYKKILQEQIERFSMMTIKKEINTQELLNGLISSLLINNTHEKEKIWMDRLIQRFEVHKNIYDIYQPGFKKGYGQNSSVRLCWLFGFSLCLYYAKSSGLKYLNTLMKICDILCSLPEDILLESISGTGFCMLLNTEYSGVLSIARSKGVSFEID